MDSGRNSDPGIKTELKDLTKGLGALTDTEGPLVLLVREVKRSNRLGTIALFGVVSCLGCIAMVGWYVFSAAQTMVNLEAKQAEAIRSLQGLTQSAKTTDSKITAAQDAINDAPKIVADPAGHLKVVATIEAPTSGSARPIVDTKVSSKKARKTGAQGKPEPVQPSPAAALENGEPKSVKVEIPIDVGQIQLQ